MKKFFLSLAAVVCFGVSAWAVDETMNPLITSMPSLSIAPDARAAGMGDLGVATEADFNSQYWNPAKYAYMYSKGGITANYTPWLRKLVSDIDLAYLAGFYKKLQYWFAKTNKSIFLMIFFYILLLYIVSYIPIKIYLYANLQILI